MSAPLQADVSEDGWLGGRLRLRQPRAGYRAGLDAALLAAACDATPGMRVLDAGCGVGAVMLAAAARRPGTRFVGLERDAAAAALARENIALNAMEDRIEVVEAPLAEAVRSLGHAAFDAALANPPFFDDPTTLRGPAPERRAAWLAEEGLGAWCDILTKAVREGGTLAIIHRADRLADVLEWLGRRAGSFAIRPLHPFAEAPAKRVLVRAVRAGRAPLRLLPPLVLHPGAGAARHRPEVEAILRGAAGLDW